MVSGCGPTAVEIAAREQATLAQRDAEREQKEFRNAVAAARCSTAPLEDFLANVPMGPHASDVANELARRAQIAVEVVSVEPADVPMRYGCKIILVDGGNGPKPKTVKGTRVSLKVTNGSPHPLPSLRFRCSGKSVHSGPGGATVYQSASSEIREWHDTLAPGRSIKLDAGLLGPFVASEVTCGYCPETQPGIPQDTKRSDSDDEVCVVGSEDEFVLLR